jgi:putative CocE/NonD family hydrolase
VICVWLGCVWLGGSWISPLCGQDRATYIQEHYEKAEYKIPMRDGILLHTTVYRPKDRQQAYPFLMNRTPYSCRPYGPALARSIGPSPYLERDGYIFVKQDVRGRWNSEGTYDNMRPHVPHADGISESSDTYDTIEWLLANVEGHNGKVGISGISYPGFYSAAALPEHHPALIASSPQAPIADFFFDDFHHQGAYILMYWTATGTFGYQHNGPTTENWVPPLSPRPTGNAYDFYLGLGPLKNSRRYYGEDCFFWKQLSNHPNYDEFWQRRSILPPLENRQTPIRTHVMTVGGWFDAEDLYGPLNIYQSIEKNHDTFNCLVMGPWSHGQWASAAPNTQVGNLDFGVGISDYYQREVELPFFRHFLKGVDQRPDFEALVYDTGRGQWQTFEQWPPAEAESAGLYLGGDQQLTLTPSASPTAFSQFESDPARPVPYRKMSDLTIRFTPRPYMTDDQRFASSDPDVLVFQSEILDQDVTLVGPLFANLQVSTTQTDADWIVKLIDVYPAETPNQATTPEGIQLGGYQQMVRSEVFRGRFRNSYTHPEPFVPGQVTPVRVPLQDVFHTFKQGHRIMIHVQSSWFPLVDRNPQKYVDNIFEADEADFVKAVHRVYHQESDRSWIEVRRLPAK